MTLVSAGHTRTPRPALDDPSAELERVRRLCGIGSWHFDCLTRKLTVSDELLDMCGMTREDIAATGQRLIEVVVPEERADVAAAMERLLATGELTAVRFRATPNGTGVRWFSTKGEGQFDENGQLTGITCVLTDISELVRAEDELRQAHAELLQAVNYQQAVIATVPDAIHVYDVATGRYQRANRAGGPMSGYSPESVAVMDGTGLDLVPEADRPALERTLRDAALLADGEVLQVRHRVTGPQGWIWLVRCVAVFERDETGAASTLLVVTREITDKVAVEHRLRHAATHDELTGLPNRRHAREQVEAMLNERVALLAIDLDGFKQINDFHGHASGDSVLRGAARRLLAATRPQDLVARLGGDEFLVVLRCSDEQEPVELASSIASRITALFAEPFIVDGLECAVTASVGIAIAEPGATPSGVLGQADAAMYEVKQHGANGFAVFDETLAARARRDDLVERSLRRAVRDGSLDVHYQPIVDPHDRRVCSVEALLRIRDDEGVLLDAGLVVSVAERCGLVSAIDDLVLRQACRQVVRWRQDPAHADLQLAVNRSAKDILRPGFADRVLDVLDETGLPPQALTVEVTETVLLDARDGSIGDLLQLTDRGVRLAIDDFGTGYASLSQLTALPVDAIKIDRSFTAGMLTDPTCRALVQASVGLAADLGLDCVVEGVETLAQQAALPRYPRVRIQGYLYGPPRTGEEGLDIARVLRWAAPA